MMLFRSFGFGRIFPGKERVFFSPFVYKTHIHRCAGQEESKGAEEERKEQEAEPTLCLRL